MFKTAATKIAHNSTLPALAGNKDLRPLQDLITLEKNVLMSLQKLSVDFTKASEALRAWGIGEGDDLGDILSASTTILAHWSAALAGYATREHTIRDHLKQIRTREEALDELKRRRKATLARADSAEKKLNKMGPEHKNLAQQTDTLNQLQAQIRQMDSEIMTEEAALGDFKRTSARALMGVKFGGLMECCEKGCVVAEVGRAIVAEISEEQTVPGMSRAMYMGHQRTEQRVSEAERSVAEIVFSPLPPPPSSMQGPPRLNLTSDIGAQGQGPDEYSSYNPNNDYNRSSYGGSTLSPGVGMINMQSTGMSGTESLGMQSTGGGYDPNALTTASGFLPPPDLGLGADTGSLSPVGSSFVSSGGYQPPPGAAPSYTSGLPAGAGSSVGGYASSAQGGYSPYPSSPGIPEVDPPAPVEGGGGDGTLSSMGGGPEGPGGGRFATFPVRSRGYSEAGSGAGSGFAVGAGGTDAPPSLGATRRQDTSGSDFMSAVLDAGEFGVRRVGGGAEAPPLLTKDLQAQGQSAQSGSASASGTSQFSLAGGSTFSSLTKQQEREREMEAQRRREREEEPAPEYRDYETYTQTQTGHSQVFEYPGALPPGPPPGAAPAVVGSVWAASSAGDGASYSPGSETRSSGPGSGARIGGANLAVEEGGGDRQSSASEIGLAYMNMGNDDTDDAPIEGEGEKERQARLSKHVRFGKETEFVEPAPEPQYMKRQPSSSSMGATGGRSRRVPPPTFEPEEDERALNAAAAREVSRELDALSFSPPPVAQPSQVQTESEGSWEFATPTQRPPTPPRTSSQTQTPSSPPRKQYSPPQKYSPPAGQPPPAREPSPLIPPAAPFARKATLDNVPTHRSIPSSEAPASSPVQPAPFVPGHHTTPSWAVSPPPDRDAANGSPVSPRLDSPYRAPFANRSTSSLNAQAAQPPPGARTISAAAFRRPQKTNATDGVADTSPLSLKKRLPTSPYPQVRGGSALRDASQPPEQQQAPPPPPDDDSFDYISAYERDSQAFFHDEGSPMGANFDYGRLGKVEVVGGTPKSPGYADDGIR
ncbi:hypothetical protein MSAN_00166100 [Mycena sanguinolenta]|uniref:Eisosome component PIL1-domain-containing protein n=1 Tax=Mycena sanguinolenta TaxID=230812 RepID=A0A8H6ZH52_9AGAR|nr:hypothetical protein MSAN_00166100 [Mycena sanguinolenta]